METVYVNVFAAIIMAVTSCSLIRTAERASSTLRVLRSSSDPQILKEDARLEGDCRKDSIEMIVRKARRSCALVSSLDLAGAWKVRLSALIVASMVNYEYKCERWAESKWRCSIILPPVTGYANDTLIVENRCIKYRRCPVVASVLVPAEFEVSNTSDIWSLLMYECWQSLRVATVSNTCVSWTA